MTTKYENVERTESRDADVLKHIEAQLSRQEKSAGQQDRILKEIAKIEAQKKKLLERQKAAKRDERLIRPSIEASKGALAARSLLTALASLKSAPLIKAIDRALVAVTGVEADHIRKALGGEQLSCAALATWLDVPFDSAPAIHEAAAPTASGSETRSGPTA